MSAVVRQLSRGKQRPKRPRRPRASFQRQTLKRVSCSIISGKRVQGARRSRRPVPTPSSEPPVFCQADFPRFSDTFQALTSQKAPETLTHIKIFSDFQGHDFLDFLLVLCISSHLSVLMESHSMSKPGITPTRGRKPQTKKISMRSATHHLAGPEQSYPVYRFSNRVFVERPKHNPFA